MKRTVEPDVDEEECCDVVSVSDTCRQYLVNAGGM